MADFIIDNDCIQSYMYEFQTKSLWYDGTLEVHKFCQMLGVISEF